MIDITFPLDKDYFVRPTDSGDSKALFQSIAELINKSYEDGINKGDVCETVELIWRYFERQIAIRLAGYCRQAYTAGMTARLEKERRE